MSVDNQEMPGTKFVGIELQGRLAGDDYKKFVPEIEQLIHEHAKPRLLVHMRDFHGWTAGGLWEDIKFEFKHFKHLERIAFVGDKKWEAGMSKFCRAFTTAKTRFFEAEKLGEAKAWLETD